MTNISNLIYTHVKNKKYSRAFLLIEAAVNSMANDSVELLAMAYDISQVMEDKSRYALYQNRFFDFGIKAGDKVLDMGSGHIPFPLATHLADIALEDHAYGRAGTPFKHVDGKPTYECSVESTPFADKEFDFVYCSHILEHVDSPEAACAELMRIGKRGYIECPTRGKDMFFATAQLSNHNWAVECINGELVFTQYAEEEKSGVSASILLDMNCSPQTVREKAVAGLDIIKSSVLNMMMIWNGEFSFSVRRKFNTPGNILVPSERRYT